MKILIVSDTHGRDENLKKVVEMTKPFDCLIHLGDVEGSENYIRRMVPCPVRIVSGNNDFFSDNLREMEVVFGTKKAFMTHGHYYYVSLGPERIIEEGKMRNADIVMFGHTHKPFLEMIDGMIVLNPGSLSYPRQEGRKGSYIIMEIDEDSDVKCEIRYLDK